MCVEAKKEALARGILQVRQLLTLPGTCLIDNATFERHACIANLYTNVFLCRYIYLLLDLYFFFIFR